MTERRCLPGAPKTIQRVPHVFPRGYLPDPTHPCTCTPVAINRYRISGPLLDRGEAESSAVIAKRVEQSRAIQRDRYTGTKIHCNAQMTPRFIKKYCKLDASGNSMLELVTDRLGFSARTIADLDGSANIHEQHIAEAIQYRSLDRKTS